MQGIKQLVTLIRRGEVIAIFPEGTRSTGKDFLEPHIGAAYFALKFNIPVLPVYVRGTDSIWPKGAKKIRFHPVRVYYGKLKKYEMKEGSKDESIYADTSLDIMEEIRRIKEKNEA